MRLTAIISIILIFLLIYRIGYLKRNSRGRYIYIFVFILIIAINGLILYDYAEMKSLHNYSTYMTYKNLLDRLDDLNIFEIENSTDIRTFSAFVNRINSQIFLLGHQLDKSSLIRGSNKDIISNLDSLNLELEAFVNYQNGIFARGDEILDESIPLYNEFKSNLIELYEVLEVRDNKSTNNIMGISQYRLNLEKGQLDKLTNILESIAQINFRLMNL